MSNVTIFEHPSSLPTVRRQSRIADKITVGGGVRRITINTNGTFKRIVGGEQIGRAVPNEINVIVVDMLRDISREYYAAAYDPDGTPTLPDCWSNDGRVPEAKVANRQSETCAECPQNIGGSGAGSRKACRFKRRLAVLAEGDDSGDVYQLSVPAASLFDKGTGSAQGFEHYCKHLKANGEAPDTVVTKVAYDAEAETMRLKFQAERHLTQEESDFVDAAFANPDTQRYIQLTVAEASGVTMQPAIAAKAPEVNPVVAEVVEKVTAAPAKPKSAFDEPEEVEEVAKPVKRATTKKPPQPVVGDNEDALSSLLEEWAEEED
jgi:hypothetical protein